MRNPFFSLQSPGQILESIVFVVYFDCFFDPLNFYRFLERPTFLNWVLEVRGFWNLIVSPRCSGDITDLIYNAWITCLFWSWRDVFQYRLLNQRLFYDRFFDDIANFFFLWLSRRYLLSYVLTGKITGVSLTAWLRDVFLNHILHPGPLLLGLLWLFECKRFGLATWSFLSLVKVWFFFLRDNLLWTLLLRTVLLCPYSNYTQRILLNSRRKEVLYLRLLSWPSPTGHWTHRPDSCSNVRFCLNVRKTHRICANLLTDGLFVHTLSCVLESHLLLHLQELF